MSTPRTALRSPLYADILLVLQEQGNIDVSTGDIRRGLRTHGVIEYHTRITDCLERLVRHGVLTMRHNGRLRVWTLVTESEARA